MVNNSEQNLTYAQALKVEVDMAKAIDGRMPEERLEEAMARLGLKEDLGELKSDWLTDYGLDDTTRDRLIAHARQDAALAYFSSNNTKRQVRRLRVLVWVFGLLNSSLLIYLSLK